MLSEVDNNVDQNQRTGLPTDPAEFAKQERLRKQREKQVRVKIRRENFMFTNLDIFFRPSFSRKS